jgi:hypothetical protein
MALLRSAMAGGSLSAVRVLGISGEGTANDLALLGALVDSGAHGITATGEVDYTSGPIIEGEITIMVSVDQELLDKVRAAFPSLNVIAQGIAKIKFADAEVERICVENWGSDGMITYAQAAAVTTFEKTEPFKGNTIIERFDELEYFTGLLNDAETANRGSLFFAFSNCTSLKSVKLPPQITAIHSNAFNGCKSLESVTFGGDVDFFRDRCFAGCINLKNININQSIIREVRNNAFNECSNIIGFETLNLPSLVMEGPLGFNHCKQIKNVVELGNISKLGQFAYCTALETINVPKSVTVLDYEAFRGCTSLKYLDLRGCNITEVLTRAVWGSSSLKWIAFDVATPPSYDGNSLEGVSCPIYVPDNSVEAYKTATGWTAVASRIKPLSEITEQ